MITARDIHLVVTALRNHTRDNEEHAAAAGGRVGEQLFRDAARCTEIASMLFDGDATEIAKAIEDALAS